MSVQLQDFSDKSHMILIQTELWLPIGQLCFRIQYLMFHNLPNISLVQCHTLDMIDNNNPNSLPISCFLGICLVPHILESRNSLERK